MSTTKQPNEYKGPFPHGAIKRVTLVRRRAKEPFWLHLPSTIGDEAFPVSFRGLPNIKLFHEWLGKTIAKIEAKEPSK